MTRFLMLQKIKENGCFNIHQCICNVTCPLLDIRHGNKNCMMTSSERAEQELLKYTDEMIFDEVI